MGSLGALRRAGAFSGVLLTIFGAAMMLAGCQRSRSKTSVLVIGVESLGFDVISCGADPYQSSDLPGFSMFCEESVRFTHALSPSPLSQAAWAALLAVDYPFRIGVHSNGPDFLAARHRTVAEQAVRASYRTGFFSGGPPLFRKSGLAQGFEIFDDHLTLHRSRPYRSARETMDRFLGWLTDEVEGDPFFAAIHLADLQFPQVSTLSEGGELRERSFSSQVRAIGEALSFLSTRLKVLKRWDSTTLVLTGMNGTGSVADLQSQSTQVALFFKPARREGTEPIEWKIDRLVSLVDVGKTVQEILGVSQAPEEGTEEELKTYSLANLLKTPDVEWKGPRYLVVETGWAPWRGVGGLRAALRMDPFLFMFDQRPKVFNTLVDRLEASPSPLSDPRTSERVKEFTTVVRSLGYEPYAETHFERLHRWAAYSRADSAELENSGAMGAAALLALQKRDWSTLQRLGNENGNPIWQFVAVRNLGQRVRPKLGGCGALFVGEGGVAVSECSDRLLLTLFSWTREKRESERRILQERFLSAYLRDLLQARVNELNFARHLAWDTAIETLFEPTLTDLFLALPENRMYATIAKIRALKEDNGLDLLQPKAEF